MPKLPISEPAKSLAWSSEPDPTKGYVTKAELSETQVNSGGSALGKLGENKDAALIALRKVSGEEDENGEVDDGEGLLLVLKSFCVKMDALGFWRFVTGKKKELESLRAQMPLALAECLDPARFVLESISEVFPVDKRVEKSERGNDLGWACVLVLESLIPVVVDPVIGKSRLLVTPTVTSRRVIGSGGLQRSPKVRSGKLSRTQSKKGDEGITIDHLHRLNPKNVSAWNMKRLMRIVRHGTITTLDEQILDTTPSGADDSSTQIRSEVEAKAAAKKIFQNVARHRSKFIYMEDLMRFLRDDKAMKTLSLFEGASESRRISKSSLKNWVVRIGQEMV
ncbi:hypothetical protein SO802_023388 [Lithocarpus litseifolius]|uniref:FRIGIDA-like protein n=1 Tax=Lithocarpus litseifolius TaxID=425828 RepID=A0AAW2C9J3_9ROSI